MLTLFLLLFLEQNASPRLEDRAVLLSVLLRPKGRKKVHSSAHMTKESGRRKVDASPRSALLLSVQSGRESKKHTIRHFKALSLKDHLSESLMISKHILAFQSTPTTDQHEIFQETFQETCFRCLSSGMVCSCEPIRWCLCRGGKVIVFVFVFVFSLVLWG